MLGIYSSRRKAMRGFTLIEMSIVLIIIGLLIGGILQGQEVIENSRQKAIISQVNSTRSAINGFVDKYKSIPGDYLRASERLRPDMEDGNGNGIIGGTNWNSAQQLATVIANTQEHVEFWNQLAAAGLISGTNIDTVTIPDFFGEGSPIPQSDIPGTGFVVVYGNYDVMTNAARRTHWLRLQKNLNLTGAATESISPARLYEIDLKIDDSNGVNGSVRVLNGAGAPVGSCLNSNTGDYYAFDEEVQCLAYFEMLE